MASRAAHVLTCKQLVELVSEYVEGTLSAADTARFEAHLTACDACTRYVEQMRRTIRMLGRLSEESLQPEARDRLLEVFRDWKGQQPAPAPA
jgi:anti-sigma factor RsiW